MAKTEQMRPFWKEKSLAEMNRQEWESLCDGCGRCCLNKFEEEGPPVRIQYTDVACHLFDSKSCQCKDYKNRKSKVKDCIRLTPKIMPEMICLPPTCAYRRLYEGKSLPWWHHLRSGSRDTVHEVGMSARNRTVSEKKLSAAEIEQRIVSWPLSQKTPRS